MKYQKIFYVVSLLLLCILGNRIYLDAKCENTIENSIAEFQNVTNCNSVNIVVYDNGKVSYYGNDREDGLYQIGSMTKAFTGLGIMKLVREGVIGHSGGTANYSSRIVFSPENNTGVCVLTNLNVAASTDRLCNDILAVTLGKEPVGFVYKERCISF